MIGKLTVKFADVSTSRTKTRSFDKIRGDATNQQLKDYANSYGTLLDLSVILPLAQATYTQYQTTEVDFE